MNIKKYSIFISFHFIVLFSLAQEGTRAPKNNDQAVIGKIMLVPFDPKLYMSEIDMKINQQTKWNFEKIRENFRQQLNNQLKLKLQSTAPVVSFYSDSAKMAKDLYYIYNSTSLSYDLVSKPKTQPVKQSGIKNGQLAVEVNTDKKFMNVKVTDLKMLSYLHTKYKTDYFVFVNQLDITNDMNSYDIATDTYQREVAVHYTIVDKAGKNLSAGMSSSRFSSKENDPKKIVALNFSPISADIASKLTAIVKPSQVTSQKK